MNRNKELAKNTVIIAIGRIFTQFISFLLLPIYTRYLSTAEYGTFDIIITCTGLIAPILSLQLERAIFRFLVDARNDRQLQDKILSTTFAMMIPPIALTIIVMPILGLAFNLAYWQYIALIIISAIISNITLQIPRGLGKNIHYSIGSMIVGITNGVISIVSVIFMRSGIVGILIANIVAHCMGTLYIFISMKMYKQVRISKRDRKTLKELLRFSIPMIPNDISYWIISISDRVLIFLFLGDAFNGIYAASVKFPTLIVTAYNMFNLSWMETVSAHIKDTDAKQYLSKTYNTIVKLFAFICMLAIAMTPFIFNIVVGENFAESYQYIAVLIFGAFFNITVGMLGAVYIGYKKTKEMARTTTLAAIINIVVNLIFIKFIGIWAAVFSTVAAYAIVTFLRLSSIQKTVQIKTDRKMFVFIIALFMINIFLYSQNNRILDIVNLVVTLGLAAVFNYGFIKTIMSSGKKKISKIVKRS